MKDFRNEPVKNTLQVNDLPPDVKTYEEEKKKLIGKVCNCRRLHVRKKELTTSQSLALLEEGTALIVTGGIDNPLWYEVTLADGTKGYCMKKYISIKEEG